MPSLIALLFPLLLRSPVLAKVASRDPVTPALIVESLASVDPDLARCISLLRFPSDDRNASAAFLCGDCVVAAGSDETIAALSQQLRGSQRLVAYGSRLSVALVGPATTGSEELAELCQQLALDTALWDQQGCLSPLVVYVADPDPQKAQRVAAGLAQALEALEGECPRGKISLPAAALFRSERMQAEMRAAAGGGVQVYTGPDSCWSVVLEGDSLWRPAPLHRFLRVCPLPGSSADQAPVRAALAPLSPHLSAVAMAGVAPGAEADRWIRLLTELGASRICAPGRLQAPPLGWHHDGQPLLLPMARVSDLELPAV